MEVFNLGNHLKPAQEYPSKLMGNVYRDIRLKKEEIVTNGSSPPAQKDILTHVVKKYPIKKWLPSLLYKINRNLGKNARRNSVKFLINHKKIQLENAPKELIGFKFLHISDLHCDISPYFSKTLARFLKEEKQTLEQTQLALITGDFQENYFGPTPETMKGLKQIFRNIPCPIIGSLGNHDRLQIADEISKINHTYGIRILINNSIGFKTQKGSKLVIQGCDDPYYYKSHKIIPKDSENINILLAHSPEVYKEAEHKKIDLCLSGHTHGGQIRLPILGAVTNRAPIPKKMVLGDWNYKNLKGHTSAGVGCSTLALRINCPPEITIIEIA